jgi:hypothetical protein
MILAAALSACSNSDFAAQSAKAGSGDAERNGGEIGDGSDGAGTDSGTDGSDNEFDDDGGNLGDGGNGGGGAGSIDEAKRCLADKADSYNIVMVFDNSGSQMKTDPGAVRQTAAHNFIEKFNDFTEDYGDVNVHMAAVSFESVATSGKWRSLKKGADGIMDDVTDATSNPRGGTSYSPALNAATELFGLKDDADRIKNIMIFMTDGEPNALHAKMFGLPKGFPGLNESMEDIDDARKELIDAYDTSIIAIASGTGIRPEGIEVVEIMATDDQFYRATDGDELNKVWDDLFLKLGDCN